MPGPAGLFLLVNLAFSGCEDLLHQIEDCSAMLYYSPAHGRPSNRHKVKSCFFSSLSVMGPLAVEGEIWRLKRRENGGEDPKQALRGRWESEGRASGWWGEGRHTQDQGSLQKWLSSQSLPRFFTSGLTSWC